VAFRGAVQLWAYEPFDPLWERGLRASRCRVSRGGVRPGDASPGGQPTRWWDRLHAVHVRSHVTDEALVEAELRIDLKTLGTTVVRRLLVALRRRMGSGGSCWRTS